MYYYETEHYNPEHPDENYVSESTWELAAIAELLTHNGNI